MRRILAFLVLILVAALPAAALPGPLGVSPNSIRLSLPGILGLGTEVGLSFEDVTGLNLLSLGLSVRIVNPNDPALRARLPEGTAISALPVILRIEPPVWGGLSFRGTASLDIHTEALQYAPRSPLRIFTAPLGGPFRDVTANMGPGSYRARGDMGGFSEFLIAIDRRPLEQVIATKLDALEAMVGTYQPSLSGSVYNDLQDCLQAIRNRAAAGTTQDALDKVDYFLEIVEEHSGSDIPNVWRAARDVENVAGLLRSGAMSLRFSLALQDAGH
jgi:hypothetical protein